MQFAFNHATRVVFGAGCWRQAAGEVARHGARVLLVTGARTPERLGIQHELGRLLREANVRWERVVVRHEPDTGAADAAAGTARAFNADVVLALGGGSAMDVAKAAAALAVNAGGARDYLEGLPDGGGRAIAVAPLPVICVPTTAGTGSEVTRNAVLQVPEHRFKRSMRADLLYPRTAFVDPELARAAPLGVRAGCAFDALTHCAESFCSTGASPLTDALAARGVALAIGGLRLLADGGGDHAAADLSLAALLGGICLANAGLGAAHGLVAPLGGLHPQIPHGAALACLLPATLEANDAALRRSGGDRARLLRLAELLAGRGADAARAAQELRALRRRLGLPRLGDYDAVDAAAVAAAPSGSLRTNPVALGIDELRGIVAEALAEPA